MEYFLETVSNCSKFLIGDFLKQFTYVDVWVVY